MRVILLIALREYAENVKTRGFWLGVLLVPVVFAGIFLFSARLADSSPTRHYVLIDQSGDYAEAVQSAISREHQRRVLLEFVRYLQQNRRADAAPSSMPAQGAESRVEQLIERVDVDQVAALNQWLDSGGLDMARQMAEPYLREDAPKFEPPERSFIAVDPPPEIDTSASPETLVEQLRPYLNGDQRIRHEGEPVTLFALILIPGSVDQDILRPPLDQSSVAGRDGTGGIQFWASNLTDTRLPSAIEDSVNQTLRNRELTAMGVDLEQLRRIRRTQLPLSRLDPGESLEDAEVNMMDTFRQWAPMGFVYLIFISLMQSVQYLLSNTIEEKSNRIIEVLLASVTPNELMMGKLLGIGASGITTIVAWLLSFFLFIRGYQSMETAMIAQMLEVLLSSEMIPWFVFYYLTGYALYSGIFLAIGSLCNTLKEAQSLMMPMMLILIVPILTMSLIAQDPNGTLARVMSWIPLFTPFSMMNRAAADPPLIDLVGTTILLLASVVLVLWLSGRVFRQGVLRTGQPPRLLELWHILRAR